MPWEGFASQDRCTYVYYPLGGYGKRAPLFGGNVSQNLSLVGTPFGAGPLFLLWTKGFFRYDNKVEASAKETRKKLWNTLAE